jgi:hypothetical protein
MITKREGLILYLCEGTKASKLAVTSVTPSILKMFKEWIKKYYDIPDSKFRMLLHMWDGTNENEAKRYWANELRLSENQFTKSWIKPHRQSQRKAVHKYGVCRLSVNSQPLLKQIIKEMKELS